MKSNIVFKNEPKLSENEADSKFNERRIALIPQVEEFISSNERFKGKETSVSFAHEGVSSLICILETQEKKLVLKIHLSILRSMNECQFLSVWEQAGVSVPHVLEEGMLNEHAYVLMDYIDAPLLGEKYSREELIDNELRSQVGATLRKMHEPKGEGYGRLIDGKGEFSDFKDWLTSENMQNRFQYVKDNGVLGEEHGSLSLACKILLEYVGDKKSSYCHFDFGSKNIFATNPITVFDPNPELNNGYLDLGRSVTVSIAHDGKFPNQLVDGYFEDNPYNKKVLQAAILVNSYFKFNYWYKTNKLKAIKNVQDYLMRTKDLLN
jgi:fructosamine-3-kinase